MPHHPLPRRRHAAPVRPEVVTPASGIYVPSLDVNAVPEGWTTRGYCDAVQRSGLPVRMTLNGAIVEEWAGIVSEALLPHLSQAHITAFLQWLAVHPDREAIAFCADASGADAIRYFVDRALGNVEWS